MAQSHEQPLSPEATRLGYEPFEISARGLLIFVIVFVVSGALIHVGIWYVFKFMTALPRAADVATSTVPRVSLFLEPDLQPSPAHNSTPWQDLEALSRQEAARFAQLGWQTDPQTRLPIIPQEIVRQVAQRYPGVAATRPATVSPDEVQRGLSPDSAIDPPGQGGAR